MLAHILLLIFSFFYAAPASAASPVLSVQFDSIPKQIFFSYTLENSTAQPFHKVEFLMYAPVKTTSYQQCAGLTSSHAHVLQIDTLGNQIIRFVFDVIPPFAQKSISVHATVLLNMGTGWRMTVDPQMYLHPTRYIESGHEKIIRTARSLSGANPMETAGKIYRFVSEHVKYIGYSSKEYGAIYALDHGMGDCTESMYLFVALCRAAGLPARCIGGYKLAGSPILHSSRYHNWAEFHDGKAWQIADPQQKVFALNRENYVATKIFQDVPEQRGFSFHRFYTGDERVKVRMNE